MPYPLPLTRTEAYLAYKAGVIQQSDLKPSLAVPRNGIDAWLAYWTGLAADYPKREDGTPHILQEEEAYIAYLCGAINEYPEKCLRRVGAYLRYLISARWGRPDHPLNREELYLSLIKTQFIPSGDPSSDIVIDGTAKAPFVDVKMYGDTFQQSYTGKNLLQITKIAAQTKNGVTFTSDGSSFVLDGTATASADLYMHGASWGDTTEFVALPAGTYTLSVRKADMSLGANFSAKMYNTSGSGQRIFDFNANISGVSTTTLNDDSGFTVFYISIRPGVTFNNERFYVQLEKGASATSFEPYVGGQPSPSPEYPQQIQTVTGEQTVTVVGKNKYPFSDVLWSTTVTSTGWRFQDGAGSAYGADVVDRTDYKLTLPAGTYTITVYNIDSNIISIQVCKNGTDSEVIITDPYNLSSTNPSSTITLTEPTTFCVRYRVTNPSLGIGNTKIQIEAGSTATAYEPYSSNDYEINLGKNLYDGSVYKTDYILGATGREVYSEGGVITDPMEVEPNTAYTASAIWHSGRGDTFIRICVYDKSMGWVVRYSGQPDRITFTTPANARYIRLSYYGDRTDSVQLELGSTPTSYAAYFTPIELCKIGDYQDYIYKDEGKWYLRKELGKYSLVQGSELGENGIGQEFVSMLTPELPTITGMGHNSSLCRSNMYIPVDSNGTGLSGSTPTGRIRVYTSFKYANTYDGVRAIAQEKGLVIYYPLATATDTEIMNTTLIAQLEALVAGGAENGTTYIKVNATDPNLPGLLYVEAPKYE